MKIGQPKLSETRVKEVGCSLHLFIVSGEMTLELMIAERNKRKRARPFLTP
jgi:hypothetical protein